jgi:rare lipoprotein A
MLSFLYPSRTATAPVAILAALAFGLAACSSGSGLRQSGVSGSAGNYKVGDPYRIRGVLYRPQEDFSYDRTGIASWYGRDFNGRPTASGEIYDSRRMTAAHTTLPMPSLVRVTNLENGRDVVLTVNDRGPFVGGRIIDVSEAAATELGFRNQGTARVRVEVMSDESRAMKAAAVGGSSATVQQEVTRAPSPSAAPNTAPPPAPRGVPRGGVSTAVLEPVNLPVNAPVSPPTPVEASPTSSTSIDVTSAPIAVQPAPRIGGNPTPSTSNSNGVYIQTGSYTDRANAEIARNRVSSLGLGRTEIREAQVNGRTYFRVRIGPMSDRSSADGILASGVLASARAGRIPDALIVVE